MASDVNVPGLVFGVIFGALFIMTCIISAVKAVRDRKRIKARIAEKRRKRLEESAYDNYAEIVSRETGQHVSLPSISIEVPLNQSPGKSKHKSPSKQSKRSPVSLDVPRNDIRETAPPWNYIPDTRATKHIIRRNSYDLAIGRYTVLCSKFGGEPIVNGTGTNLHRAYENDAYNCDNSVL